MAKVKMAILGCGGMSGEHARRYKKNEDVEIVALCDVNEEIVNGYIERNLEGYEPRPQVFTDAATMYREAKPDAVTIVTPHTMHFDHGMQALDAGCHVFMEKADGDGIGTSARTGEEGRSNRENFRGRLQHALHARFQMAARRDS